MEHFSHPDHSLNLVNEGANADPPAAGNCHGCRTKISAPYYYCVLDHCPGILLHKYCAELAQNVEHHLHPAHALTLSDTDNSKCNACHEPCHGLSYSCADTSCDFTIDTLCAMKTLRKHEFHQHPLFSSPIKAPLACRACNLDSEGTAYQCTTCRFWVHQHCASLPKLKRNYLHPHMLKLTYSLQDSFPEYDKHFNCHICREEIQPHNWAYHCFRCRFFTHAHNCSDPNRDVEDFDSEAALAAAVHLPIPNEHVSLTTLFFMDANGTKTRRIPFLDPNETCGSFSNETCSLCERLLAAPCNNCALCKYFLPKSPSELRDPYIFEGFYEMIKGAEKENYCDGFVMSFRESESIINISCSVLPRYVKHEGHCHVLSTTYIIETSWCDACQCDFKGYGFRCNFCNFTIDSYCAMLPGSVSHRYDKEHPFKLTYYSIDDVEEYICEICEEDITTMWFYHCEDCDYSIHPRCIWKIHIKFGPILSRNSDYYDFPLVVATKRHPYECCLCGLDGCRHFLDGEEYYLETDEKTSRLAHMECLKILTERWPREQEEFRSILARFRRIDLNAQTDT